MAWLRIDDGFTEHHKLTELGNPTARWTWLEILVYCARRGNEGKVPASIGEIVKRATPDFLERCITIGLLDKNGDGMRVHDWADYNPKDPTKAERQARWRAKTKETVDSDVDTAVDTQRDDDVDPPARARARGPSPTPEDLNLQGVGSTVSEADGPARRSGSPSARTPRIDPSKRCDECGATLGEGHQPDCPVLKRARAKALA